MTTITATAGDDLRRRRTEAGLTQVQLAALAGCSLTAVATIEQGLVPRRSRVLEAAFAAIASYNSETPAGTPGLREETARQGRHDQG